MIGPLAEKWLRAVDQSLELYAAKPVSKADTVLVPAAEAFPFYEGHGAYLCQAG